MSNNSANSNVQPATKLDTMTFPLHGARLIEASAGTGKTFTIAGLYLRLLLGHGDAQSRHQRPLEVGEILVVTFTEAATAELRGRIRARIRDAKNAFLQGHSDDPVIKPLINATRDHHSAAQLLLNAERQMDDAAIYTIHGFCQRMLVQNAFESGSRFNNEFVTDESHLKQQVVADFWRHTFYSLDKTLAQIVRQTWAHPSKLYDAIRGYLSSDSLLVEPQFDDFELNQLHAQNIQAIEQMKQAWRTDGVEAMDNLRDSGVDRRSYSTKNLPSWIDQVTQWANSETFDYQVCDKLEKFRLSVLEEKTKKGTPPDHALFSVIDSFLDKPLGIEIPLLSRAIQECRHRLQQEKHSQQLLSFDDLLSQLNSALLADSSGRLAQRIRQLYPVAMIDEFQDTDSQQYSIFRELYLDHPQCGWFMIGDPKQAIYAFRGADIFTYIQARKQVSAHYTLDTNWRSSHTMISAANGVFEFGNKPFIYDDDIPFHPVNPSPVAGDRGWQLDGETQSALNLWSIDDRDVPVASSEYRQQMAQSTAAEIQQLLEKADNNQAQLIEGGKEHTIQPGNIAVLVRTGAEGKLVKEALAKQGIASVYLSNRDSVFKSSLAQDVHRVMDALLNLDSERKLRAALASSMLGVSMQQLHQYSQNETDWEGVLNEFADYRERWQKRGVLPMLRRVLYQRGLGQQWLKLSSGEGERLLTDYLHLAELLQQQSQMLESDHALLRWLGEAIEASTQGANAPDEQILRLESERNLVQIVTIHKSKGLEYDLVFLPFAMSYRAASEAKYFDQQRLTTVVDLEQQPASLEQADRERLAEDLRLLYVALTRAVYGCFIGVAPIKKGNQTKGSTGVHLSALGYLLQQAQDYDCTGFYQSIDHFINAQQSSAVSRREQTELSQTPYQPQDQQQPSLTFAEFSQNLRSGWRVTSYSGLVKQSHHQQALSDLELTMPAFDSDSLLEQVEEDETEQQLSIFSFPRGARPGTLLHTIFEEIDYTEPSSEPNQQIVGELLEREGIDGEWLPVVMQMVEQVLTTDLAVDGGEPLQLCAKSEQHKLVEMEFVLPIELLSAANFNQIVQQHDPLSKQAEALDFYPVQGMLKGFIDLVFEHNGRYFVLDWKSNHLGDSVADYHPSALQQAMLEHRYDMQYQIYALALHRFLRQRIPNYDYQHHFGGVYYLFLRGMDGQSGNGVFYTKPSLTLLEQLDTHIAQLEPSADQGVQS